MKELKLLLFFAIVQFFNCEDSYYIKIGEKTFPFTLKNTSAANELKAKLPLKIQMTNFNGNEVYYTFSDSFTTNTKSVGTINTGDIYLYQSNTLVLFYKTFTTTYSYTELGSLTNSEGLAEAIGSSSQVMVEWGITGTDKTDENSDDSTNNSDTDEVFVSINGTNQKNNHLTIKFNYEYGILFPLLLI